MNRMLHTLQSNGSTLPVRHEDQVSPCQPSVSRSIVESAAPSLRSIITSPSESQHARMTMRSETEAIGKAYITFCADQPLPLFPKEGFVESLSDRADDTLFAVIAIASRYTIHTQDSQLFRDTAHLRIMASIGKGNVQISTLQALCLVILFDFTCTSSLFHPNE